MAKDGRETYLSTYLDQASQGIKTLSERDRTAMKIFHKRIRENGVYFLVDNLAATTSTEEIENLNVYQEGFLRPPYETITLALDALNTGGTTTPTLVFIDCFSGAKVRSFITVPDTTTTVGLCLTYSGICLLTVVCLDQRLRS